MSSVTLRIAMAVCLALLPAGSTSSAQTKTSTTWGAIKAQYHTDDGVRARTSNGVAGSTQKLPIDGTIPGRGRGPSPTAQIIDCPDCDDGGSIPPTMYGGGYQSLPIGGNYASLTLCNAARQLAAVQAALSYYQGRGYTEVPELAAGGSNFVGSEVTFVLAATGTQPNARSLALVVTSFPSGSDIATQVFAGVVEDSAGIIVCKEHDDDAMFVRQDLASATGEPPACTVSHFNPDGTVSTTTGAAGSWSTSSDPQHGTSWWYMPGYFGPTVPFSGGSKSNCFWVSWGTMVGTASLGTAALAMLTPGEPITAPAAGMIAAAMAVGMTNAGSSLADPRCW